MGSKGGVEAQRVCLVAVFTVQVQYQRDDAVCGHTCSDTRPLHLHLRAVRSHNVLAAISRPTIPASLSDCGKTWHLCSLLKSPQCVRMHIYLHIYMCIRAVVSFVTISEVAIGEAVLRLDCIPVLQPCTFCTYPHLHACIWVLLCPASA